jgi:hypothetical protein
MPTIVLVDNDEGSATAYYGFVAIAGPMPGAAIDKAVGADHLMWEITTALNR